MSFKDFRVCETLGKGSFASVYKVIRKSDNKVYALKRIKINKMSKREISDSLKEIQFLASIRHKNIVGFYEAFLENNDTELCIIMEYCGCGDLAQKVERYKRRKTYIDEDVIWRYMIQSLKALEMLHAKGICHRDLKTANSFLAADGEIKIGDMNVSKRMKKGHLQTQIGTPYYMSPEIWNNRPYDEKSDMWSLGCMIYELCALRPPFVADSFPALKRCVTAGRYSSIPRKFSDSLGKIIGNMLSLNPRDRQAAAALLNHPDMQRKMHLDGAKEPREPLHAFPGMMATIKVPQNMKKLGQNLPKPCYADARPNTPSAWVVADQKENEKNLEKAKKAADAAAKAAVAANEAAATAQAAVKEVESNMAPPAPVELKAQRKQPPQKLQSLANENAENENNNVNNQQQSRPVQNVPRHHSKVPSVPYESNNQYRYGANPKAPHAAYEQQQRRYGGGYGQYGHYNPSGKAPRHGRYNAAPPASNAAGGYYNRYNVNRGRAAGQPSRAAPVKMW